MLRGEYDLVCCDDDCRTVHPHYSKSEFQRSGMALTDWNDMQSLEGLQDLFKEINAEICISFSICGY